jgi:hypothetical protein
VLGGVRHPGDRKRPRPRKDWSRCYRVRLPNLWLPSASWACDAGFLARTRTRRKRAEGLIFEIKTGECFIGQR